MAVPKKVGSEKSPVESRSAYTGGIHSVESNTPGAFWLLVLAKATLLPSRTNLFS
jgi:hypothetical protein